MLLQAILMELAGLRGGEHESRGGLAGERKGISGEGTEGGNGVSMFKITLHMYESAMLTPIHVYKAARPKKLQVGLTLESDPNFWVLSGLMKYTASVTFLLV